MATDSESLRTDELKTVYDRVRRPSASACGDALKRSSWSGE